MEVLIYDMNYLDIPLQDLPERGNIVICHDPQKRLNSDKTTITWAVVKTTSDNGGAPPGALGLFWDKEMAELFANAIAGG